MSDDNMLRARAREAINAGRLPDRGSRTLVGGVGSGEPCAVCGKDVEKEDVELAVKFASDENPTAITTYHLHAKCFTSWELERRNGRLNSHSLPPADDRGIMPSRECNTTEDGKRG